MPTNGRMLAICAMPVLLDAAIWNGILKWFITKIGHSSAANVIALLVTKRTCVGILVTTIVNSFIIVKYD